MFSLFKKSQSKKHSENMIDALFDDIVIKMNDFKIIKELSKGDNNCTHMNLTGLDSLLFLDENNKTLAEFKMGVSAWVFDFEALKVTKKEREVMINLASNLIVANL